MANNAEEIPKRADTTSVTCKGLTRVNKRVIWRKCQRIKSRKKLLRFLKAANRQGLCFWWWRI